MPSVLAPKMTTGEKATVANAGISALGSILTNQLKTEAFKAQVEADTNARLANINNELMSYELNAYKLQEDHRALDNAFADKVGERTLQGMKDFATLKAAAAESGTTGGSTSEAVNEAFVNEMFDVALINQQRKTSLASVNRQAEISKINSVNKFKSLASGGVSVGTNSLLSGLAGGINTMSNILATMPNSVRAEVFGMDTSANKVAYQDYKPKG